MSFSTNVLYKLPHQRHYTHIVSNREPLNLSAINQIPLDGGYVIMPFVITPQSPLLFIRPDNVETCALELPPTMHSAQTLHAVDDSIERMHYSQAFQKIKQQLTAKEATKVVLSRRLHIDGLNNNDAQLLFLRACYYRPNSFVALWNTPQTGQWLVATPEPLLEVMHHQCSTVALAGTLPWIEGKAAIWNNKNKEEQAIVARYINEQLKAVATDINASATYTLHSGNIQHLCTDFTFSLRHINDLTKVLQKLHPTPAVCGLPCKQAKEFILQVESSPRQYYAGFSGPLNLCNETHLFVSLRCMQFTLDTATLYAGGGIMPESIETDEWEETQRKMYTIKSIL